MRARRVGDRVEHGDLAFVIGSLGIEHADGGFDHVAQAGALAFREVADGVLHVFGRIAVPLEYRLVDPQRIGPDALLADIGIRQKRIAEDHRKFVVGYDLVV